jgi:competence protein ComEA
MKTTPGVASAQIARALGKVVLQGFYNFSDAPRLNRVYDRGRMRFVRFVTLALALFVFGSVAPAQTSATKKEAAPAKSSAKSTDKKTADKTAPSGGLIDINSAGAAELKTLPGIGDAYSAAIIKNRPYANKTQLKSRNVIPSGTYEKIKDKVIAKQ